jgi:hypothetical protein
VLLTVVVVAVKAVITKRKIIEHLHAVVVAVVQAVADSRRWIPKSNAKSPLWVDALLTAARADSRRWIPKSNVKFQRWEAMLLTVAVVVIAMITKKKKIMEHLHAVVVAVALAVADSRRWIRKNNVKSPQWVDALLMAVTVVTTMSMKMKIQTMKAVVACLLVEATLTKTKTVT